MAVQVVILAAGQSKRMQSALPKVLHRLAGKSLIEYVIQTAATISSANPIVIYGHQGELIKASLGHLDVRWIFQPQQMGTAHALLQALPAIVPDDQVLVLYGDVPLTSAATLHDLISTTPANGLGLLTATVGNPQGYGRIKRDQAGFITGIVEEKDANREERVISEINPGIYLVPAGYLNKWLPTLNNHNAQGEYYLTDIVAKAVADNISIHSVEPAIPEEILGVNDRVQLSQLERFYQRQLAEKLMRQGVTICDPARLDIRGEVEIGRDVMIDVNVILEGRVVIGDGCVIGAHSVLRNTVLQQKVEIKPHCLIDGAEIAAECMIGPFARLRPGTVLGPHVHIGNFVEIKNSDIAEAAKVNHLSYIGDSELGKRVNVGAGTITCNYDGMNKHKTVIGDDVHIGSDTQLVAPITIGEGATIGAGSTVVKDVSPKQLILTHRLEQRAIKDWQRPQKDEK